MTLKEERFKNKMKRFDTSLQPSAKNKSTQNEGVREKEIEKINSQRNELFPSAPRALNEIHGIFSTLSQNYAQALSSTMSGNPLQRSKTPNVLNIPSHSKRQAKADEREQKTQRTIETKTQALPRNAITARYSPISGARYSRSKSPYHSNRSSQDQFMNP
jgi:hypothetical protein